MDEHNFDGVRIFNRDKSGFSTVPSKISTVIALRGMRRVDQIASAERGTMVTMALIVSAGGNSIPPFFIFPRQRMETSFLDNVSPGTKGFANGSGWMCQPEFVRYMRYFIENVRPSVDSPVLLLLDNHTSHLSIEAIDMGIEHGVYMLSFPAYCSHNL